MALYTVSELLPDPILCKWPKHCCFRQCFGCLQNVGSRKHCWNCVQRHLQTLQSKAELSQKDFVVLYPCLWSVDLIYIRYLKMQWLPIDFIPNIFHRGWNGNGAVGGKHKEVKIWPDWIESRHALMPRSQLRHNGFKVFLNLHLNFYFPKAKYFMT